MARKSTMIRACLLLGVLLIACGLQASSADTSVSSADASAAGHRVDGLESLQISRLDGLWPGTISCASSSLAARSRM